MRFAEFLKSTVLASAAAASALAAVTLAGASAGQDSTAAVVSVIWWIVAGAVGVWLGRRAEASPPIARLLASARATSSLPEVRPALILLNRLWPLLVSTVAAGAVAFLFPQVPGMATGFAIIWALAWRRQAPAVEAIEGRDGVQFFLEPTALWEPARLIRTPGFKTTGTPDPPAPARRPVPAGSSPP